MDAASHTAVPPSPLLPPRTWAMGVPILLLALEVLREGGSDRNPWWGCEVAPASRRDSDDDRGREGAEGRDQPPPPPVARYIPEEPTEDRLGPIEKGADSTDPRRETGAEGWGERDGVVERGMDKAFRVLFPAMEYSLSSSVDGIVVVVVVVMVAVFADGHNIDPHRPPPPFSPSPPPPLPFPSSPVPPVRGNTSASRLTPHILSHPRRKRPQRR